MTTTRERVIVFGFVIGWLVITFVQSLVGTFHDRSFGWMCLATLALMGLTTLIGSISPKFEEWMKREVKFRKHRLADRHTSSKGRNEWEQ
jgi:CDP-diglyceride synthetase